MYFNRFKTIYYPFDIDGKTELKVVKDITTNVRFRKEILSKVTLFDEYDIVEGDTPDIIAAKYYGSSEYHWIVMLCNEKFNHVNDFPLNSQSFELYVHEKYGDTLHDTVYYINSNGHKVNPSYSGSIPISNYEHETRLNESKRRIKLIAPALLSTILINYKSVL